MQCLMLLHSWGFHTCQTPKQGAGTPESLISMTKSITLGTDRSWEAGAEVKPSSSPHPPLWGSRCCLGLGKESTSELMILKSLALASRENWFCLSCASVLSFIGSESFPAGGSCWLPRVVFPGFPSVSELPLVVGSVSCLSSVV